MTHIEPIISRAQVPTTGKLRPGKILCCSFICMIKSEIRKERAVSCDTTTAILPDCAGRQFFNVLVCRYGLNDCSMNEKDYLRREPFFFCTLASLQTSRRCLYSLPFRSSIALCPSLLVAISTNPNPFDWCVK